MSLFFIICVVLIGLTIIVVEIVFIPGTTIVGIFGFFTVMLGLYLAFIHHGEKVGWFSTASVIFILVLAIYFAIKKKVWQKYSLQSEIHGTVDNHKTKSLVNGQEGVAISALRPSGIAEFSDTRVEVSSQGTFIDAGTKVKIISIKKKRVIVETV